MAQTPIRTPPDPPSDVAPVRRRTETGDPAGTRRRGGVTSVRERPRERLARLGSRALASRELIAALVGSGSASASATEVADRILASCEGRLGQLARRSTDRLASIEGVGPATAARVAAALELGRRVATEEVAPGDRIRGPRDVWARMGPPLRHLAQEEFHALLLNAQHVVLREVLVTRGILDASLIHPREVFRSAVEVGAAAVILVHNHPSGDPTPSAEDRAVTRQLVAAGRALGIPVLDHVVVGDGRWRAFSDEPGGLD
ncbi:MAG: DNA repair protein RadC [Longimicrobiales bacterium]|nr:DNA repair protein RadC [Longimicrobiales bacterium]